MAIEKAVEARLEHELVQPLLYRVLWTIVIAASLVAVTSAIEGVVRIAVWGLGNAATAGALLPVVRRGNLKAVPLIESLILVVTAIYTLTSGYGLLDVSILILPTLFLLTSALLSTRWMVIVVLVTTTTVAGVGLAEKWGWLVTPNSALVEYDDIVDAVILLTTMAAFVQYLVATMRRAIVEARLAHKKTRDTLDATNEAIIIHDAKDGRILDVNEPTLRMFGCSRDEIVGQAAEGPADARMPSYAVKAIEYIRKAVADGPQSFEWLAHRNDGPEFWIEVGLRSATIADEERVVAVLRDISARRRMERQVIEAETFRAVGQLAGGVAHDFNNQLVGIFGNAEFLRDAVEHDAELLGCANSILASGRHAADLTQQLLAFARRGRRQSIEVDIHQLIGEVITLGRHSLDKRIVIEQRLHAKQAVTLGDPSALQNALLNLLLNARDAMPQGGLVEFSTRDIEIEPTLPPKSCPGLTPGSYLEIAVADTGSGIAPDTIGKVFEPFFTTKEAGVGMGLAAVKGTILEHQGSVDVESRAGRGTIFRLQLPVATASSAPSCGGSPTKAALAPARGRILVVDDESAVLSVIERALARGGYEVDTCGGGQAALKAYVANRFTLVLLDVMMPDIDGVEVLRRLRTRDPEVQVMLMTGHAEESIQARLREFPDVKVLSKPFLPSQLLEEIRSLGLR